MCRNVLSVWICPVAQGLEAIEVVMRTVMGCSCPLLIDLHNSNESQCQNDHRTEAVTALRNTFSYENNRLYLQNGKMPFRCQTWSNSHMPSLTFERGSLRQTKALMNNLDLSRKPQVGALASKMQRVVAWGIYMRALNIRSQRSFETGLMHPTSCPRRVMRSVSLNSCSV